MKLRFIFIFLIALLGLSANAQISFGGLPSSLQTRALRAAESIPCITIYPDTTEETVANQFAYQTNVDIDITKESAASVNNDRIIYRLQINSDHAKSINLIFSPITLPDDAKIFLFRPDGREIYGAYTRESFAGNVFATTPLSGDSIMVQCEVPIATADSFSAIISSVNTGFDELRLLPTAGKSQKCETDFICQSDGFENQSRSTCLIIINGKTYCTGSLIATTDNDSESFVLTAAHCLRDYNDKFDSTLANKSVFFFGFNAPICEGGIIGSYEKSISGSKVASAHPAKDMTLLKLSRRPPVDYMTYESGWNIEMAPHGPVTSLHHPNGDQLKISISDNDPTPFSFAVEGLTTDAHWLIENWSLGITESGSSGAPLYDNNGLIIGALSGGSSTCSKKGNDKYWRLNSVWDDHNSTPVNLMSVLDPTLSGIVKLNGKNSYDNRCYPLKHYDDFSELDEPYKEGYGYAAGNNSFGLNEFAEKFTSPYSSTEIHGISFVPIVGKYDENYPVYLRIYSGNDKPESLVYESIIRVTAKEYQTKGGGFSNKDVSNWSYKENYIRLDSAVTVGKTFFVAFQTDYENGDFALLATTSDTKTAFFKKNDIWESWDNHPFYNSVGSLLISSVVREVRVDASKSFEVDEDITVYPNPANDMVRFRCKNEIRDINIFNAVGATLVSCHYPKSDSEERIVDVKNLANGVYSAEITTDKGKYHTKFIKE